MFLQPFMFHISFCFYLTRLRVYSRVILLPLFTELNITPFDHVLNANFTFYGIDEVSCLKLYQSVLTSSGAYSILRRLLSNYSSRVFRATFIIACLDAIQFHIMQIKLRRATQLVVGSSLVQAYCSAFTLIFVFFGFLLAVL